MADVSIAPGGSRVVATYAPRLGLGLAVLALVLLALAPLGWRLGLWHYRISFFWLMTYSGYAAIGAVVVSLLSLLWWTGMASAGRVAALLGLVIGAALVYVPWHWNQLRTAYPPIHDITTDMANPPAFSAAQLAERKAEQAGTVDYDAKVAEQQKQAYPDIQPLKTALPPADAFKRALDAAQGMSGWRVVASDPAAGRIEAAQSSTFFGFTDDVVIRVAPDGSGSRIDIRSESRQGRSDFGVNATRVRSYLAALKQKAG
jgi:uncharacterized protein (DUF1499 family)